MNSCGILRYSNTGVCSRYHLQSDIILLMIGSLPGHEPIDPRVPMLEQENKNGDLVFRNVKIPVQSRFTTLVNMNFYMHSLVLSCMADRYPPPDATRSFECYVPYGHHHSYHGHVAQTKSGKPCKVSTWGLSTTRPRTPPAETNLESCSCSC
eukprot:1337138-Pyramimonas_sp.AAC.1